MVKNIKRPAQQVPGIPLPFPPTPTPSEGHVLAAANTALMLQQMLFQGNPGPVIAALKAAEHVFSKHVEESEEIDLDAEAVEEFQVLGVMIGNKMIELMEEERKQAESGIVTPDTGLVGPDGSPIASGKPLSPPAAKPEPAEEASDDQPPSIVLAKK